MNKRPSLQFYPADWLKDTDLQMCSMNTIGIWINLICRMWEVKEEGILKGKAGELALLVGARPSEFKRFLSEAGKHGFCDVLQNVTESYPVVIIKCRRMNKMFLGRERAKEGMRKHRQEKLRESYSPSSSTSSTSSTKSVFKPPTLLEIQEYAKKKNYNIDCKKFFEWYTESGWKDNKGKPIKNWKLKIISWSNHGNQKQNERAVDRRDTFSGQKSNIGETVES